MRQGHGSHGVKCSSIRMRQPKLVASGEKLLKESGTIYESFADMMSPGMKKIFGFSGEWKQRRIDKCRTGRGGNTEYNMEYYRKIRIMYPGEVVFKNPYGRWFTR